jgi:UDP-N-acetylglucosamine--N-acetylmuramyl-(pentapeptide) pyrophosphoryl-undecaprenol N-acetylglucosamine transferase
LIKNIGLPFKLIKSFIQVRGIVNQFKPDAVIGVGGYSSFPVLRFAQAKEFKIYS